MRQLPSRSARGKGPEWDIAGNAGLPLPTTSVTGAGVFAVTAAANRANGASGRAESLPPDPFYRCCNVAD